MVKESVDLTVNSVIQAFKIRYMFPRKSGCPNFGYYIPLFTYLRPALLFVIKPFFNGSNCICKIIFFLSL